MRILVIGRGGQLALSLAEAALPAGASIAFAGRPDCDIRDAASVAAAIDREKPDIVVIAAAYTAVDRAETEEAEAFAVNADGPANVGKACAARGVPVIHVSTDYVYDGAKAAPYVEGDATHPLGAYGRSKLAGEERLAAAQPACVILRTAWVHSPFGGNFVRTMLRLAETRDVIGVVDDQRGNPTYAPHLADAVLAVAAAIVDGAPSGVYHAVGGGETSWFGLAREVFAQAEALGMAAPKLEPITTADYPTPARRPANSRLDAAKLRRTFGVTLPAWQEGVAACVARLAASDAKPLSRAARG